MIQRDQNSCSTQDQDTCIENYITNQLNNSLRCKPKWMDLNLPTCKDLQINQLAEEDAQISLQNIDLLCQRTCKTIEIKTWSRNFIKDITRHRIYLYFPFKVAVHTEKYLISPLEHAYYMKNPRDQLFGPKTKTSRLLLGILCKQ